MSNNPEDGNYFLANISNYSGVFDPSLSYKKFDFVYDQNDGLYYYAKKDISFGGNVQVSGDYRFDLVPDGPIIDNRQSYYIYDKWNQLGLLNQGFSAGQEISIQGSMQGSNGNFEVLEVEESVDAYFSSEAQNTIISALDLTELAGGWYRSSWFFIPNKGEVSELDKSLNYLIEGSNWIYNTLLGWLFINLDNSYGKNFWFYMPQFSNSRSEGDGVWLWADIQTIGSSISSSNSFIYLGPSNQVNDYLSYVVNSPELNEYYSLGKSWDYQDGLGSLPSDRKSKEEFGLSHWVFKGEKEGYSMPTKQLMGAESWVSCSESHSDLYSVYFYNYSDNTWFGKSTSSLAISQVSSSQVQISPESSTPSSFVPNRLTDGVSSRLIVRGVNENSKISAIEEAGGNNIILTSVNHLPSSSQDAWASDRFFFDADYGSNVNFKANVSKNEFGNGYYSVQPKGINCLDFEVNLDFKNRTNREANAIIHFLESHQGQLEKDSSSSFLQYNQGISGFNWDGSSTFHPYDSLDNQSKTFYCSEFSHSLNFENSNDISVKLRNFNTSILNKSESLFVNRADDYSESSYYSKNDVVFYPDNHQYYYFHSGSQHQETLAGPPALMHDEWTKQSGYCSEINKEAWTREFFWKPSVGLTVSQKPKVLEVNLNDSYSQIYKNGINANLLNLNLNFNNRDDAECYSILHFLEQHYGSVPFIFYPPAPYETEKAFICRDWSHVYNFKNNHSISVLFEEFPLKLSSEDLINQTPPAIKTKGEIIAPSFLEFSEENEEFSWDSVLKKRFYIKNVGGTDVDISSLRISSERYFRILGKRSLGETYCTEGLDRKSLVFDESFVTARSIYLDILEQDAPESFIQIYSEDLKYWSVGDFIGVLMNDDLFLYSAPSVKKIKILYKDLLGRDADSQGLDYYINESDNLSIVESIMDSSEFCEAFLLPKTSERPGTVLQVPLDKLLDLNLQGRTIKLKSYDDGVQGFETFDDGPFARFIQYPDGKIKDEGSGTFYDYSYFINSSMFEQYGTSVVPAYSEVYIDIVYQNKYGEIPAFFLEDNLGERIEWNNYDGSLGGGLKISNGSEWLDSELTIQADSKAIKSELRAWVTSSDKERKEVIEEENEAWKKAECITFPLSLRFMDADNSRLEKFGDMFFQSLSHGDPVRPRTENSEGTLFKDAVNCRADWALLDSSDFVHYLGLWVPYEFKTFSIQNGGVLLPRPFSPTSVLSSTGELKINSSISLDVANSDIHTLISIEPIDSSELPLGYSSGWSQKGIMKIHSSKANTFEDNLPLPVSVSYSCFSEASCFIEDNAGLGNIQFSIEPVVYKYGMLYDSELESYYVENKDGDSLGTNLDLNSAYSLLLRSKTSLDAYKKMVDYWSRISCRIWRHLTRTDAQDELLKQAYSNQGLEQLWVAGSFIRQSSPLPYLKNSPGFNFDINFMCPDIDPRFKEGLEEAILSWQNIIQDDCSISVDIVESSHGRVPGEFGFDPNSSTIAYVASSQLSFIEKGMRVWGKDYPLRASAVFGYNPEIMSSDESLNLNSLGSSFAKEVSSHELGHVFGLTMFHKVGFFMPASQEKLNEIIPNQIIRPFGGDFVFFTNSNGDTLSEDENLKTVWDNVLGPWETEPVFIDQAQYDSLSDESFLSSDNKTLSLGKDAFSERHNITSLWRDESQQLMTHSYENEDFGWQYVAAKGVEKYQELIAHNGYDDPDNYFYESAPLNQRNSTNSTEILPDLHFSEFPKKQKNGIKWQPAFPAALMTPFIDLNKGMTQSRFTLGCIEDLGYTVDYTFACSNDHPSLKIDAGDND